MAETIAIVSMVVSPVVKTLIDDVSSLITKEYLLVDGVEKEVRRLSSTLTTIHAVLEDAQKKQLNNASLRDWLGKLKNAAFDAGDILESYTTEAFLRRKNKQARTNRSLFSISGASNKHHAAHNIEEIVERFDQIAEERKKFHLDVSIRPPTTTSETIHTGSYLDVSDVVGRQDDKEKIIDLLLNEDDGGDHHHLHVLPIIGMGGLGKTTLAQLVYNDDRIISHFEFRIWVCITVKFDLARILREMIEGLSKMRYDINLSKDQLESRLLDILKGKHFLLVLDDVWTDDHLQWKELQGFLKRGGNGSSVLVTSRSIKVSDAMGTKPPYKLSYLPEEECWSLFKLFAFNDTVESSGVQTDLEKIGKEIVRKCNGLPLAVKAMGGLLHGNTNVGEWQRISNLGIWEVEEEDPENRSPKIIPALKLSYDHLPSHLKECFAYCSIFPKAYVFDKKELVKMWMAESLIKSKEREKPEDTGNNYFDELLFKSFFHVFDVENKDKRYRMHDLIHDLAQSISSPHCYQVRDSDYCNTTENTRHLSILCTDVEKPARKIIDSSKKLRTLLMPSDYLKALGKETLNKLFCTFKYMRVLDLSSNSFKELPKTIEELKLLRYLDLSNTDIEKLPDSICNLINLETLKLLGCLWLFELPRDFGNLSKMRHLELDEMFWYKSSTLPPRLGGLTSLHTLRAYRVRREKGHGIEELKDMAYLTGALHIYDLQNVVGDAKEAKLGVKENLNKVVFEWSGSSGDVGPQQKHEAAQENVLEDLQPHSNIKELQILHYKGSKFPGWIRDGLLQNLVSVSIKHCTKCSILSLGQLPCLEELCIEGMPELEEWSGVAYRSLRKLKVSNCPKLYKLSLNCPDLREMKIKRCDSLKALANTPSLAYLILIDNPSLEDWHELSHLSSYSFIHLLELKVINCYKLKALPELISIHRKLEISGCELLITLPMLSRRLHHLALGSCNDGTLVRAIPCSDSLLSLVITGISNLISLSKWPHLPGLKTLYIRDCKDLVSFSEGEEDDEGPLRSLASLKLLSIRNCPKLETLPNQGLPAALECLIIGSCPNLKLLGPNKMFKSLASLTDLYIEDCPYLQSLPEDGLPTTLQNLHIRGCPLLTERCRKENGGGPDWPKIMHVPDLEIDYTIMSSVTNFPNSKKLSKHKTSSSRWFPQLICSRENDIMEHTQQPQRVNSGHGQMKDDKGKLSKTKMTQGESSSSATLKQKKQKAAVASTDLNKAETFLDHKRKKKWVDAKCGSICFMLYARDLFVTHGNQEYWIWDCFKETSEENIEVVKLSHVCWLDVRGKLKISDLTSGTEYEIIYVVKVTNGGFGWELPITLRLTVPDEDAKHRQVSILDKPRGEWFELSIGCFQAKPGETREVYFDLYEHVGGHWKKGLIIKGVIIRPVSRKSK